MKILKITMAIVAIMIVASCGTTHKAITNNTGNKSIDTISKATTYRNVAIPTKDFRAVWIATIGGIDWPREHFDESSQKKWYEQMLDTLESLHINTVFFQVRPKADAFYNSPYEPWSQYITGYRGKDPGYDVLRWLIDETHKRGMAFHAWMNPYRIDTRKSPRGRFDKLDPRIPKRLVKDYRKVRLYNPALPETRQRLCDIVGDMLKRYDVDGIHFDDYFYPDLAKGEKMRDWSEYRKYGKQYLNINEFRRAMVDSLVVGVHRTIKSIRPSVVFSISPQGNYENNYNTMYADVALWSDKGWCDVIIPQLYWSTERWFRPRLKWFSEYAAKNTHLAVGYGLYRFGESARDHIFRTNSDLQQQMQAASDDGNVVGSVLYSANWLMRNPVNINKVIGDKFKTQAIAPYLGHFPENKPTKPAELKSDGRSMSWDKVDGCYYAIYEDCMTDTAKLIGVSQINNFTVKNSGNYFITAVRKGDNAESLPSQTISIKYEENTADIFDGNANGTTGILSGATAQTNRRSRR